MMRKAGVPAILIGLCIVLYFAVFIRPGLADLGRGSLESSIDLHSYFLPRFRLGSELLLRGHLPIWNRFEYGGIPLLATGQPAALYPPKIVLFGFLPQISAFWIFMVSHFVALAAGFLFFLRDRDIHGIPAFVGAALVVFPVPLLDSNYHPNRIANLAWVPLLYVLSSRVARGSVRAFGALAVVVALQLTAGYPEVSIDIGLLLAAHAIGAYLMREWAKPPWKVVPVLGLAFAVGGVAAALQLLPIAELGQVASRDVLVQSGRTAVLGGPRTPLLLVPGFIPFVLVGFAVRKGRLAALGFAICAFVSGGGWRLLSAVPGFGMIRFGFTWVFLAPFFLAWAGAAGCDAVLNPRVVGDRARRAARWLVAAGGITLAVCWALEWRRLAGPSPASAPLPWSVNVGSAAVAALGIAGGIALAVTALLSPVRPETWVPALFVLTVAHLRAFPFGAPPAPFSRPSPTGIVAKLHGKPHEIRSRVLSPDDILYGYEITDRLPSPLGAEISFMPWRYRRIGAELGYLTMFASLDWEKAARATGFFDAMDVAYVAAPSAMAHLFIESGFRMSRGRENLALLENDHHMGHAWINYAVRSLPSEDDALHYVLGSEFDPHREVVLEESTERSYPGTSELPADPPEAEQHPKGATEFHVNLPRPGILVFSESAYPGRTAAVDGKPAKILRADYVLCAVELSEGWHRVTFEYDPPSVRRGLWLSAFGCAAILGLLLYGMFGKRRAFWAC